MVVVNHPVDVSSVWRYLSNLGVAVPEVECHDLLRLVNINHVTWILASDWSIPGGSPADQTPPPPPSHSPPSLHEQSSSCESRTWKQNDVTFSSSLSVWANYVLFWTHFSGETLKSANVWFHRAWNMVSCVLGSSHSNSIRQFLIEQCLKLSFGFTDLCRCRGAWLSRV